MDKEKKKPTEAEETRAPAEAAEAGEPPAPETDKATEPEKTAKPDAEGTETGTKDADKTDVSSLEAAAKSEKTDTASESAEETAEKDAKPPEADTEQPSAEAAAPPAPDLRMELLNAKAQLAAFKSGVRGDAVEDAVCLALHDAKKTGEVSEKSVAEALKGVLDRHPEWKQEETPAGSFRVGADGGKAAQTASSDEISKIFGNA